MDRDPTYLRVLEAFGHYGFRKASMADLAEAAGVSRQTLYNRCKTKDGVLEWAVDGFASESETAAIAALRHGRGDLADRLTAYFGEWLGSSVDLLRSAPHGAEIFDLGKQARARIRPDAEPLCRQALIDALSGEAGLGEAAEEAGFVLLMASKGLLLASPSAEAYAQSMQRVIAFILAR